jgi:hypothetical protein
MRLSHIRGTATRQDRSSQLRRDQEAAPKLRTMFPMVEQLRFDLHFEGGGASTPVCQTRVLHPPARAYFLFPCPYSDCDGWFDLATVVHAAVGDPSHRVDGVLECAGLRGGNFTSKLPCCLHLRFTLTAVCSPAH